jgi:extradiol dioxygenase
MSTQSLEGAAMSRDNGARLVHALGYLGFETGHRAEWESFAPKILGATLGEPLPDGSAALRLDDWSFRIALVDSDQERLAFIGWEVGSAEDLASLQRRLASTPWALARATDDELSARQVAGMAWCLDPSGNRLEFFHGQRTSDRPWAPGRSMSGFLTGELGLGHLVVAVPGIDEALAFYADLLGFRLSDRLGEALYFLGCNQRHHSIGLANIGGQPRTLHVMLEVLDLDDVGRAFDLCVDEGIRSSMIGLHSNDRMTSFYITTPSGFEIEYGWHGLLVDDATWTTGVIDRPSVWGHRQLDMQHPPTRRRFQQVTP